QTSDLPIYESEERPRLWTDSLPVLPELARSSGFGTVRSSVPPTGRGQGSTLPGVPAALLLLGLRCQPESLLHGVHAQLLSSTEVLSREEVWGQEIHQGPRQRAGLAVGVRGPTHQFVVALIDRQDP